MTTETVPTTIDKTALKDKLTRYGMIYSVISGFQFDLNAAFQKREGGRVQASLCDHNCTKQKGGYECPAARTKNRGIQAQSLASADTIVRTVVMGAQGLRLARNAMLSNGTFTEHCRRFEIPNIAGEVLREALQSDKIEVNLFGGNPELHPKIMEIIKRLKAEGFIVNLTTTGRRLMRDEKFVADFRADPANILALSADDFELDELKRLLGLSLDQLKEEWKKVNPLHGQGQKAIEAIYGAKLLRDEQPPLVLFNMVLHPGNIGRAGEIIRLLGEAFPNAIVNPYPNQEGFHGGKDFFSTEQLEIFRGLVQSFLKLTVDGAKFVKRLSYWMLLDAAFKTWGDSNPQKVAESIAGYGIWQCYRGPGSGRYLQGGRSVGPVTFQTEPGNHLGCFWNSHTVTQNDRQIETPEQVASYLSTGMTALSRATTSPCPGCAMPRLLFDLMNIQAGMDTELIPAFIRLRREYVGF